MENKKKIPTILIIVGITGDLAKRKLLPAICNLIEAKVLPEKFKVLGTTRHEIKQDQFLTDLKINTETKKNIEILNIDLNTNQGNIVLLKKIKEIEKVWKNKVQIIFNLSVPPQATIGILEALAKAKFNLNQRVKLLLEKPFGEDLIGAKKMIKEINKYFNSKQIYRLDHYLAKEMAQNVLVFRKNNPLFRETFNHKFIESIEIIATESIGIEGRVNFFEQTGSLRDLVQSHLLQLAALTLLDINKVKDNSNIQALRAEALNKLIVKKDSKGRLLAKRGQYENYKKEVNNQESFTETFVNLELISKDKNWKDVPIVITTGKSLAEKSTKIIINYKNIEKVSGNKLIFQIQPNEGIDISIISKTPGYERKLEENTLSFRYDLSKAIPESYQQVLVDVIYSNQELFISDREVIESWRIIDEIEKLWKSGGKDLIIYKKGSSINDILNKKVK